MQSSHFTNSLDKQYSAIINTGGTELPTLFIHFVYATIPQRTLADTDCQTVQVKYWLALLDRCDSYIIFYDKRSDLSQIMNARKIKIPRRRRKLNINKKRNNDKTL